MKVSIRLAIAATLIALFSHTAFAADEISMGFMLQAQKGYLSVSKSIQALKTTMTGASYDQGIAAYTSSTPVTVSADVGTQGVAIFRNTSTSDCAVVTATFLLAPGQAVMGPLHTNVVTIAPYTNSSVSVERLILSK